jgi:hypothetical protein
LISNSSARGADSDGDVRGRERRDAATVFVTQFLATTPVAVTYPEVLGQTEESAA